MITLKNEKPIFDLKIKRKRLIRFRPRLSLLPNLFTLANAFFGFSSILFAADKDLTAAAYLILLGSLMDMLDGRIARMTNSTSELGVQLDSLADAITFCLAPAFFVYMWQLHNLGFIGYLASAGFLLAGLYRLAKFNVTTQQQSTAFIGMPTTLAGTCLATIFLNTERVFFKPTLIISLLFVVAIFSYLMLSTLRFPSFKYLDKRSYALSVLFFVGVIIILGFTKMLLSLFIVYFLLTFIELVRQERRR
jgi:CDP-diacylglycerol--serine O-phosphatidyltransferase